MRRGLYFWSFPRILHVSEKQSAFWRSKKQPWQRNSKISNSQEHSTYYAPAFIFGTYIVSGLGKATAVGSTATVYEGEKPYFGMLAAVYYTGASGEEWHFIPFSKDYTGWQFASGIVVPRQDKPVYMIKVYLIYKNNSGMAYFDNISVTKEPCSSYTYDDKGNPVSAKEGGAKTSCEYQSGTSILTKYTASTGVVTSFTYAPTTHNVNTVTSAGVTSTNSYNSAGLVTQTVSSGNGESQKTSSSYDAYGQRTAATDVNGTVTKYEYALGRRITGTTVGTQARQEFNYNSADRMTMTSMEGLAAHHYSYSNGQLSALARKSRVGTGAFTWQSYHFAYDLFGNMTKISVSGADNTAASAPSSAITLAQYRYENGVNNGRLQELTFGNGQTVQYTYDRFDRTTAEQYNNVTYEYAYDASGQLAKQSSTAGEEYNYEYDSLGRLIRSSEYNGGTLEQRTEHVYDASDRLTKQTWYNSGGTTTVTYAYSPTTGLLTSLNANIQGSSIPVTYTYQGANQLRSKTVGGVMVRAYNFRYNNDGSKSALPDYINYRDPAGELMCGDNCFYDESGRLIEIRDSATVNRTDVTPVTIATYGYDRQGQLTAATVGGTSYTYTYDTAGNIQSKKIGGTTTNYTYGNSAWRDLLTAYDGHEISYDGCGNPTRYYDGSAFTWTQGRRLATATVGNTNISYAYDMAGVRSSKTVNGTEYKYTTLSGLVTRQTGGGKTIDFIYDDSNQPLAMKYNGTLYYYILNAQGDVVRIIDGNRNVVASYSYDPWGKIISSSGALAEVNPLRYRGYYYDSETGFYYLRSRYYDPELGRFINADSYASTDATGILSANMFAYCENDPVNKSDPTGEFWNTITNWINQAWNSVKTWAKNTFGASATIVYQSSLEEELSPPLFNYIVTVKAGITESATIVAHGDSSKLFSVYAQGRSDNYAMSSVGAKMNIGRLTLGQSLGIDNLGVSSSFTSGDQTVSYAIKIDLSQAKIVYETSTTINNSGGSTTEYTNVGFTALGFVAIYMLLTTGSSTQPA